MKESFNLSEEAKNQSEILEAARIRKSIIEGYNNIINNEVYEYKGDVLALLQKIKK